MGHIGIDVPRRESQMAKGRWLSRGSEPSVSPAASVT